MAFSARSFTVNSTAPAEALVMSETGTRLGSSYLIRVLGADVWMGGSDVNTTDKGFPLYAGEAQTINLANGQDSLYFVTGSGTATVYVLKQDD